MRKQLPTHPIRRRLILTLARGSTLGLARRLALASPLMLAGLAMHRGAHAAQTKTETRDVSGFDGVVFAAAGDLSIEQAPRESLTIEAEPEVLRKITSEVHGHKLTLGFGAGNVIARAPIRFRLQVRELRALELRTSGSAHLGALDTDRLSLLLSGSGDIDGERITANKLDVRLSGSGTVSLSHGQVDRLRIEIGGSGTVDAAGLQSRDAQVSVDGSGDVRLTAADHLVVRIGGSGSVRYAGNPQLEQSITGAGTVERD